uniref:Exocyst complex component Sec10 n=1 Tax=Mucochytrium quahogii TaxID=96639 RepID=A0A7S2S6C4_9STRA|mmetsp:Transcript_801/g.1277  ORF Transcript_801/g.1277 Transcript_801/m.1277 type:complete len:1023 (+) Transcript_801:167-3235(+)
MSGYEEPLRTVEISLTTFAVDEFNGPSFVDRICSQDGEIEDIDFLTDDLGPMRDALGDAILELETMGSAVNKRIDTLTAANEKMSNEMAELAREQSREQDNVGKEFRSLERKFGRSSETALGIGSRLEHLDDIRNRAVYGLSLINYFNEFVYDEELTSPVFVDLPRRLADAAPLIHDLESLSHELGLQGVEEGCERIEQMSGKILTGLLDEFDKANSDGDLDKMRLCADAILENFRHKQGNESLFQRFVFYSLNPLVAARKRSIAFKNAALKDNLAHLFSQIRSLVRTTHVVVSRVFPNQTDEILSLLVSRLFNDSVYGLQPMLHDFLYPSHREGGLPHNEYLQLLFSAHNETEFLVQELIRGLKAHGHAATQSNKQAALSTKMDAAKKYFQKKKLGKRKSSLSFDEANLQTTRVVRFDTSFIHKQMQGVFQQFTIDYADREAQLFCQRLSKRLFATLPYDLVRYTSPNLTPPPDLQRIREDALRKKRMEQNASKSPTSPTLNGYQDEEEMARNEYLRDPVESIREILKGHDESVEAIVSRTIQLRSTWQKDLFAVDISSLFEFVKECNHWKLEDVELIQQWNHARRESADDYDEYDAEDLIEDFKQDDKTFLSCFYVLRGVPGQAIRWSYESHQRGIHLLGNKTKTVGESQVVVLEDTEENKACFIVLQDFFQALCDQVFDATLVPLVNLLIANMPKVLPLKTPDPGFLKTLRDDMDFRDESNPSKESDVVMVGEVTGVLHALPTLSSNDPQIKSLSSEIGGHLSRGTAIAYTPSGLELFIASTQAIEDSIEQMLLYWRDSVFPAFSESANRASWCQNYLEKKLGQLERLLATGLKQQVQYCGMQMQAVVIALHNKLDYYPKENSEIQYDKTSAWCKPCVSILTSFIDLFSRISSGSARDSALEELSRIARDVILASLRMSKISLQGSFTLVQDISSFERAILENNFLNDMPSVKNTWEGMRLIPQLFIVQSENLRELISDENGGLMDMDPRLINQCVSRRSDFRKAYGARSAWAKTLFQK